MPVANDSVLEDNKSFVYGSESDGGKLKTVFNKWTATNKNS